VAAALPVEEAPEPDELVAVVDVDMVVGMEEVELVEVVDVVDEDGSDEASVTFPAPPLTTLMLWYVPVWSE